LIEGVAALQAGDIGPALAALAAAVTQGRELDDIRGLAWAGIAASFLGDDESAAELIGGSAARARMSGEAGALAFALMNVAILRFWQGRIADAEAHSAEGRELARETEQVGPEAVHLAVLAAAAAVRGDAARVEELAAAALELALPRRLTLASGMSHHALAAADLVRGRAEAAMERLGGVVNGFRRTRDGRARRGSRLRRGGPARRKAGRRPPGARPLLGLGGQRQVALAAAGGRAIARVARRWRGCRSAVRGGAPPARGTADSALPSADAVVVRRAHPP
jgi:hypothetical protein